ncbi:hypothetical protein [Nocardia sp. NPDC002869]|uniref:hypothetical protein n=1 Tax=Nocardia sp. NPDC002869 TaxID=3161032 RepID=UPI00398CB328
MFRAFEPGPVGRSADRITLTVGQYSSPARHRSVRDLAAAFGIEWRVLSGAGHAAHLEAPGRLAHWVRRHCGADLGAYCLPPFP